jgi:hypothetical protein
VLDQCRGLALGAQRELLDQVAVAGGAAALEDHGHDGAVFPHELVDLDVANVAILQVPGEGFGTGLEGELHVTRLVDLVLEVGDDAGKQLSKRLLFALEVQVEGALRQLRSRRDVLDLRAVEPAFGEDRARCVEQAGASMWITGPGHRGSWTEGGDLLEGRSMTGESMTRGSLL